MAPTGTSPPRRLPACAVTLLAALAIGCGEGVNEGDVNIMPLEVEWRLGEGLAADVAQQLPLVEEGAAPRLVATIGQELVRETSLAERPWQFHVVAGEDLNAFAIPGGHVYVFTGLLDALESRDELAAVLGHEIAHGVARHGTEQLTKAYGFNVLAALVLGDSPALYEEIAARLVGGGTFAKFSRDNEREADRLGIEMAAAAGYDAMGMAAFLETLLEAQERRPGLVEQLFATHPLTEQRVEQAVEVGRAVAGGDAAVTPAP